MSQSAHNDYMETFREQDAKIKKLKAEKAELLEFIKLSYDKVGTDWEYDKAYNTILYKYKEEE